jgi:para-aminobenzoate synthetase component 1
VTLVLPLDPAPDPAAALRAFADLPYVLFLDSAGSAQGGPHAPLGRYSYLGADPAYVVRSRGTSAERRAMPGGAWTAVPGDAVAAAMRLLAPHRSAPDPALPPFQGGLAGYIGYDWGGVLERVPPARYDDLAVPDAVLGLYDWVIAWDHAQGRAWIVSTGVPDDGDARERRARERARMAVRRLSDPPAGPPPGAAAAAPGDAGDRPPSYPVLGVPDAEAVGLRSTFTHRGYLNAVTRVREYILAGDIFQANLSQRFDAPLRDAPLALYGRLRSRNPAPFAAYLDCDEFQILSASPERFLRLEGDAVETRPIKGTRPRGQGPMHDAALGRALAESAKDRAENVMIVDLLRNDLSRVCRPGTVRVPELFALEQHPTVHHLVSTVVGRLADGGDAEALLRATFPGGSITGAPKVRAMEIIAELEPTRRGVYCGSIGWIGFGGDMDTSIVIRTFVARGGRVYFQAGGGIVADSDPELEYQETLDKARGLIAALNGPAA